MEPTNRKPIIIIVILVVLAALAFGWYLYQKSANQNLTPLPVATSTTETQTPTTTEPTSPLSAVEAVGKYLANILKISADKITVISVEEHEWPDSCLGLPKQGEVCAQMMVPGFEIVLQAGGKEYHYRTNIDGTVIKFDAPPNSK